MNSRNQPVKKAAPAKAPRTLVRLRLEKLCLAVEGRTPAELINNAQVAVKEARFIELRLDSLPKPADALPLVKKFLHANVGVVALATCRRKANGGGFTGTLAAELEILAKAAEAGCQMVDLEIESAEGAKAAQLEALRAVRVKTKKSAVSGAALGAVSSAGTGTGVQAAGEELAPVALMISYHDFQRTKSLLKVAERIEVFEPDYVKVVSTAKTLVDNLAVLELLKLRSAASQIVALAMGEEGIVSRILGPREGAVFTFAAPSESKGTAPGQLTAYTLREHYRFEQIDAATKVYGVFGNPIAHSLSPLMQNTAFRKEGVNAVFLPLKAHSVEDLLALFQELPLAGAAVTIPFKCDLLPHLTNMDAFTQKTGAVNTLRMGADGKLYGFNTDVAGVVRPLERRMRIAGARIAVVGAGGAARAAVFGLVAQGAEVFVVNRTHEKAVALARKAKAKVLKADKLVKENMDVLINATSCGMLGSKTSLPVAKNEVNAKLVFDLVYNPLETPLIQLAKARGIPTISGLEMFVQQGVQQFEIWTARPAPEAEMMRTVRHALEEAREKR
jgi:3-dehydroquinate dehydratase / shikimate dehydrogenase